MDKYTFETRMEVRDYECDLQGIVNNANYLHYLEHTRHLFMQAIGTSFSALHQAGTDTVVARINLQYKSSLRPGDAFISRLGVKKEGIKYVFMQSIVREEDQKVCVKGTVEAVALVHGRLGESPELDALLGKHLAD